MKKTILIDLDGVLNEYKGSFDMNNIPPVKNGAKEFLKELSDKFIIKIFTTRDYALSKKWVIENKISDFITDITNIKEPSHLIVDDRCVKFCGDYKQTLEEINNFKAWYK